MSNIGEQLRTARDAKGITVPEASHATRIMEKQIEAMETENFSELHAPAYVRGFLRLYGKYLDLDPEPLVEAYNLQYGKGGVRPSTQLGSAALASSPAQEETPEPVASPVAAGEGSAPPVPAAPAADAGADAAEGGDRSMISLEGLDHRLPKPAASDKKSRFPAGSPMLLKIALGAVAFLILLALLRSCGGSSDPTPPDTHDATAAPAAEASSGFGKVKLPENRLVRPPPEPFLDTP